MSSRRRSSKPPIIGPFFIVSLIVGLGLFLVHRTLINRQLAKLPPPVVERQRLTGAGPQATAAPDPAVVRDHAAELKLTPAQEAKLDPIVTPYLKEKADLERQLQPALKRFEEFQAQTAKRKHTDVQEIQEHMAEISQLSGEMAALRQRYWLRVKDVLTEAQRRQAEELWRRELAKGPRP